MPYIVSIESGALVLSEKQGLAYFFYSLDEFSIQSIDTEDQIAKMKMFSATLRLSASSHLTLCFINYSQMRATLSAIHCAQGFNTSFDQYECIKLLPPTSSIS